jgi:hypothetical protein
VLSVSSVVNTLCFSASLLPCFPYTQPFSR